MSRPARPAAIRCWCAVEHQIILAGTTQEGLMIDHIGFPVSDYERAKAFYVKALAPLDYVLVMEVTQEQTGHDPAAGFGANGKPDFWIGGEGGLNKQLHVAIRREGPRYRRCVLQGRRSRRADATTARPGFARIIIRITTAPSCSIPTATTSRRCATRRVTGARDDRALRSGTSRHRRRYRRCRSNRQKSRRRRRERQPSRRGKSRRAIPVPRCRRRCASPASHRCRRNCRARCRMNYRCAGPTDPPTPNPATDQPGL